MYVFCDALFALLYEGFYKSLWELANVLLSVQ